MKTSLPLFLFFTILLFHLHLCFADDAHDEFKACGLYYNCGELVNISYPFWGNERQNFCGRREFELSCKDNETTTIQIHSREYIVLNISQADHRMTIARSELFDDYCPNNEIGAATLDFSLFKYSSNDLNLSVWYDCPQLQGIPANLEFECGSEGEGSGRTNYALEKNEAINWSKYNGDCRMKIEVTITLEVLREGKMNRTMVVEKGMKEGFEVEYGDLYTIACEGCEEFGGACVGNATEEFLCRCKDGDVHPYVCKFSLPPSDCRMKIEVTISMEVLKEGEKNKTIVVERGVKEGFEVEYGDFYSIACEGCKENGGECGGNTTQEFYCVCGSDKYPYFCKHPPPLLSFGSRSWVKVVVGAFSGISGLIISIIIIVIYYMIKRISNKDKIEESIRRYSTLMPKRYNYSKLKKITDSFKNKLGQGGFSTVYRGKLPDGRDVAVKLLSESRENDQDFINEVVSITRTAHVNIASLLGFCYERKKRALIYEYMPRGSLDKYISHNGLQRNNEELDWNTLYRIVTGVARGLEYLHRGCNTRILHFDIKPHNILLDTDFCPKISDFGLAKQCNAKESHVSMTCVKGTVGFIAPEVIFRNFGKVSPKSDVYSYGMLVLDMVGARKNPNGNDGVEQSSEVYFPDWIYNNITQSEIDGGCWRGNTKQEEEMTRQMIIVGLHCIQTLPDDRPSMTNVVAMLEGSVDDLQIPPKPNLFGSPVIEQPQPSSSSIFIELDS